MEKSHHYPFCWHEGMTIVRPKPRRKIFIDIKQLFAEHQLLEEDTAIIYALSKYRYLNAFLIRMLLEPTMEECTQSFITKRLSHLEEKGLVIRFQFAYTENNKEHRTPFVYEATYKTRKLFERNVTVDMDETVEDILRRISYNQFHIFLERQMGKSLLFSAYHFAGKSDGAYRFLSNGKPVNFFVLSIRSEDDWKKHFLERLRGLIKHIKDNDKSYSGIIIICENEMQGLMAERYRMSSDCRTANIYYICDYAAVSEGYIFSYLIDVKPDNNYSSYNIIMVPADGNIHVNTSKKEDANEKSKPEENQTPEPKEETPTAPIAKRSSPPKKTKKKENQ